MKWSPFNPDKVIKHVPYWAQIKEGKIPPPVAVQLSPTNTCNLDCEWCMAEKCHEGALKDAQWSARFANDVPTLLRDWGVKAVYFTGGGEPTLYKLFPHLARRIRDIHPAAKLGLFTNGSRIHRLLADPEPCFHLFDWVGVSLDAGTPETYRRLKGRDLFDLALSNIAALTDAFPYLEVTVKYLVYPGNEGEIAQAAQFARDAGARYFHIRPASPTWWDMHPGHAGICYNDFDLKLAHRQTAQAYAMNVESGPFRVVGTQAWSKYDDRWIPVHRFAKCRAMAMYLTIEADQTGLLCCDRRGDPGAYLIERAEAPWQIQEAWGSKKHWDVMEQVDPERCPKCTMANANEVYRHFIDNDTCWADFI